MNTTNERIAQLEEEVCQLKAQLEGGVENEVWQALKNMPDGTVYHSVRDMNTGILKFDFVSGNWEKILGVSAEESIVNLCNIFKYIVKDDLKLLLQKIEMSLNPLTNFSVEVRFIHPVTKKERWIQISSYPRMEGDRISAYGFIFDITARKETEQKVVIQNERLLALDYMPDGVLYRSVRNVRTGTVIFDYVSSTWEKVMGVTEKDTLADLRNVFVNILPDDLKLLMQYINERDDPKEKFNVEIRYHHPKTDKTHWFQVSSYPRLEGDCVIADGFIFDVTVRKEVEQELSKYRENLEFLVQKRTDELNSANEELAASNEELYATNDELSMYKTQLEEMVEQKTVELILAKEKAEESDRLKSAFLANMSHETRTPLNGIVGFLKFIDSDNLPPERRKEYIKVINNNSKQLAKIIDDIIDISKIEAQQMTICPVPVQLNDLMNELRILFESYIQGCNKSHIELILDDSGFIDNCVIYVDTVRLRQVFNNLISNAVKFTEKGYIRFGYRQSTPSQLEFVVEDTGVGLPLDQQEIIFERFRQADLGNNRHYGGTGLGLTISRSLIHLKGGKIWVESNKGAGTSFYFTIPYLPIAPEDMYIFDDSKIQRFNDSKIQESLNHGIFESLNHGIIESLNHKHVLLVEPVHTKFKYYEKLISATGATVTRAENVKEWSEHVVQNSSIDIVIANASLLDNEKIDNIRSIKNLRPDLPIALIIPDKKEKYMQIIRQNLCNVTVEIPINYAVIADILENFLKSEINECPESKF